MSSLLEHCHGEKTHFSRNEKKQLTDVTLGDTSGLVVALQKACTDTTSIL